jgi:hypothetical protein
MSKGRILKYGGCELSTGNIKVGDDTLIINMNAATDCPSAALGLCKLGGKCYALKAERLYPRVLPFRRRQAAYWQANSALKIASDILAIVGRMKNKPRYVRLSESGDFESQADVMKAELIAMHLQKNAGIKTYTYSARSDLNFKDCTYLAVKGSGHDNGNNGMAIARPKKALSGGRTYTEDGRKFSVCPSDCRKCKMCKNMKGLDIVFAIH